MTQQEAIQQNQQQQTSNSCSTVKMKKHRTYIETLIKGQTENTCAQTQEMIGITEEKVQNMWEGALWKLGGE